MTTPITLASKDPNEEFAYSWTPQDGDTIASGLSIDVTVGSATLDGSPALIDENASARFVLVGGADGEITRLTAIATMASGDVIEQEIRIPIVSSSRRCIDLALAKQHLEYEDDDRDALILQYIDAAQAWVEGYTGLLLTRRTVTRSVSADAPFYDVGIGPNPVIDTITYLDGNFVETAIDGGEYILVDGRLYPTGLWPAAEYGLKISITAGFEGDIPADLMSAQLLMIGHLFEARSVDEEAPASAKMLAHAHRIMAV